MIKRSYIFWVLLSVSLVGCGMDTSANYAEADGSLANRFSQAVWYAEVGEGVSFASRGDGIVAEDGELHGGSILLTPPNNGSTYINGVFHLEVPDDESLQFHSWVGFPQSSMEDRTVTFQLLVQEGDQFPSLAVVDGAADGHLDEVVADLSAYRGQNVVLILASSWEVDQVPADLLWIDPSISNSLR